MAKRKKTEPEVIVTEDVIIISLPPSVAAAAKGKIRTTGKVTFKIKEITVESIPSIKKGDHPVQQC